MSEKGGSVASVLLSLLEPSCAPQDAGVFSSKTSGTVGFCLRIVMQFDSSGTVYTSFPENLDGSYIYFDWQNLSDPTVYTQQAPDLGSTSAGCSLNF